MKMAQIHPGKQWILAICIQMIFVQLTACVPSEIQESTVEPAMNAEPVKTEIASTPLPVRQSYSPGQLVDYIASSGDTLPGLASHFNTTVKEIHQANPIIPNDATTMPPGLPMKIPIYYQSLWGTSFKILPDSRFVYGPPDKGFDPVAFVKSQPGWLKDYVVYASGDNRVGGQMVELLADNYSVSPRLILAMIEYQTGALTKSAQDPETADYPLGYKDTAHKGLYLQLSWAVNYMSNGYYDWRSGNLKTFDLSDGRLERPDPWQNAGTVGLQYYFARVVDANQYQKAVSAEGLYATYVKLFGTPWDGDVNNIPGSLKQPYLRLPFLGGKSWAFTGGPHPAWGDGAPFAALDFAPPAVVGGCAVSNEIVVAVADGVIARADPAIAVLDLDGDGDERTGWDIFYLHLASADMVKEGTVVKAGDRMGRPSCEGGHATGTHVHIARKYNGEWILADSPVPFDVEGWVAKNGSKAYQGTLTKFSRTVEASESSDIATQIQSEAPQ
jgi:murein DD-endopeptidase MepM/ murein hydrolase activator NlpD